MNKVYYVIGDIHGMDMQLFETHQAILVDVKKHDYNDVTIVHVGDYIDRGPGSKNVLDFLMDLEKKPYDRIKIINLLGNHEDMMLNAHDDATKTNVHIWLINGGEQTLESFGVKTQFNIPKEYYDFLRKMPIKFVDEDNKIFFVHAGIHTDNFPLTTKEVALWSRYHFFLADHQWKLDGKEKNLKDWLFVHGHTPNYPSLEPEISSRRINTDTGACFKNMGYMTAVKIIPGENYSRKVSYVQVSPELMQFGSFEELR